MLYRVILKKVSFGIFSFILVSKGEKNFTMKSKDEVLSMSKFSWYRVIHKKLSHKTEDKMQEKMKMILQVDENLAHL